MQFAASQYTFGSGGNVQMGTAVDSGYRLDVVGTGRFSGDLRGTTATFFTTNVSADGTVLSLKNNGTNYPVTIYSTDNQTYNSGYGTTFDGGFGFWTNHYPGNMGTLQFGISGTTGAATFSSTVTATGFFESSDSRLKTLIQDNYQTKGIASITPKLYTKNGKVELGYYAQDLVGILDSAVSKGSDDMLSLSYREVLVAKVYALEQQIKELKSKMN
jgi:hypothetical protein